MDLMSSQMRIRWFMYPEYYLNMTWEEQARDRHTMGHFSKTPLPTYLSTCLDQLCA